MALRLNDLVVCGELLNTRKNCVHGYLGLRGFERPLVFELAGNCAADLAGRHIRFEVRNQPDREERRPPERGNESECGSEMEGEGEGGSECEFESESKSEKARLAELNLTGLAWMQIGPTGTMTAARKVRVADCPPGELYARCKLGEPPPMTWKQCLYLEWFSQNGRVVVELVDPVIEVVEPEQSPDAGERVSPLDAPLDEEVPWSTAGDPSITSIRMDADGEAVIRDETPHLNELEDSSEDAEGAQDPYELIPRGS